MAVNATPNHPTPTSPTQPTKGGAGWVALILAAVLLGFVTAPHVGTAAYRSTVNHTSPTHNPTP